MTVVRENCWVCAGGTRVDAAVPPPGCALSVAELQSRRTRSGWYRTRGYPHFDRSLAESSACALATNPERVASHAFHPFLAFHIARRRYKKQDDGRRLISNKPREVAAASHADAAILSYYTWLLKPAYEAVVKAAGIDQAVIAYRRFTPPKCNIHFAMDAFQEIERRGECRALALDIEGFFDNIPHEPLKQAWVELLNLPRLPSDHFAVFKAVTRWAKVDRDRAYEALGIGRSKQEQLSSQKPLCSAAEFRKVIRGGGLIEQGWRGSGIHCRGIPQGSPISALLSNLLMLEFDKIVHAACTQHDVYYRRYSDDILIIGHPEVVQHVRLRMEQELQLLGMSFNDGKALAADFGRDETGELRSNRAFQYLGFTFDGQRVLIRPETLAKFAQRMKRGVESARRAARSSGKRGGSPRIRRQELYARFGHVGPTHAMRRRKATSRLKTNFYSYAMKSGSVIDSAAISRQLRRHWPRLQAAIELAEKRLND